MKKLSLALVLTLVSALNADNAPTTTATAPATDEAAVATVTTNIEAVNTDATIKATVLAWIKAHPYMTSAIVTTLVGGGFLAKATYNNWGNNWTDTKGFFTSCGDTAKNAGGKVCEYKKTAIASSILLVIAAACIIDLNRGENSLLKKLFTKKPVDVTPIQEATPVTTPATT